jgi:hypothetical protein
MATTLNLYDQWRDIVADPTRAAAISGTLKCAIVTGSYTPDQNLHDFWNDANANEVSGSNYTAGGNACASPTWTGPDGSGVLTFDASNPAAWLQHASGFSNGRRAILYYDTGTPSTSRLVAYTNDFGADSGNVSGDFSVEINALGIYTSPR